MKEQMKDEVKRLTPKTETLRRLYLKSGNQCAFPNCDQPLLTEGCEYVGNACHIEAALEGGERFNTNMTNEERRSYENLILLCPNHHKVTNNVDIYSVAKLKEMKRNHERKVSESLQGNQNKIVDYGKASNFIESKTANALNTILGWKLSEDECIETCKDLNKVLLVLLDIPIETRQLLAIMVERGRKDGIDFRVSVNEIASATRKEASYLNGQIDILINRRLVNEPYLDGGIYFCDFKEQVNGCEWFEYIQEFCKKTRININDIFVKLDFSLFD